MKAIDQLICVSKSLNNQCIDNAKKSGKKVVGYICSYAPEKIIHAAGTVPYRLRAIESNSTGLADAYFSSLNCSFARHVFNNALSGKLKFLDGAVFMNSCDRSRRIYDNWRYSYHPPAFRYILPVPNICSEISIEQYKTELSSFIKALEKELGTSISPENLKYQSVYTTKDEDFSRKLQKQEKTTALL